MPLERILQRKRRVAVLRDICPAESKPLNFHPIASKNPSRCIQETGLISSIPSSAVAATIDASSTQLPAPSELPRQQLLSSHRSIPTRNLDTLPTEDHWKVANSSKAELLRNEAYIPLRSAPCRELLSSDIKSEGVRAFSGLLGIPQSTRGSTPNRHGQRLATDSGVDTARSRKRSRQDTQVPSHLHTKTQQVPVQQAQPHHGDTKKVLFACPYYKFDPDLYLDCRRYELRRVKDVRQHLLRKHMHPICCPRCCKAFESTESLECHQRSLNPCDLRDADHTQSSISKHQWDRIAHSPNSANKKKSVEEQWREIWDILFPDATRPKSIYLGNSLEETLSRLRAFWATKRSEIVKKTMQQTGPLLQDQPDRAVGILSHFVECFLGQFEAETTGLCSGVSLGSDDDAPITALYDIRQALQDDNNNTASTAMEDSAHMMQANGTTQANDPFLGYQPAPFSTSCFIDEAVSLQNNTTSCPSVISLSETNYTSETPSLFEGSVDDGRHDLWTNAAIFPALLTVPTPLGYPRNENRHTWHGFTTTGIEFKWE